METPLPTRPTQEQIDRSPSSQIAAILHGIDDALASVDSTLAKVQLRQAYAMADRARLAQIDAESEGVRRLDLKEGVENQKGRRRSF